MEILCALWVLVIGCWLVWKGAVLTFRACQALYRWHQRRLALPTQRDLDAWEEKRVAAALAQKKREDARAACELLYHSHAHVLKRRLPKETFLDFVRRYMGDDHSAEYVEERGRQLQELILLHVHRIEPPAKPYTIQSLTDWYRETKQIIENLPVEDRTKQAQLALLNTRFAELSQALMETLQP